MNKSHIFILEKKFILINEKIKTLISLKTNVKLFEYSEFLSII
jgi:hypothetical protein